VSESRIRRSGLIPFIAIVQGILFLAHALVFETVNYFWGKPRIPHLPEFFILVSISFVPASLLVWRYTHFFAWAFYRLAAVWLGCLSFFFWGSVLCWVVYGVLQVFGLFANSSPHVSGYGHGLLIVIFSAAALASVAAVINASWVRVTRVTVNLPGLPDAWRRRTAVLASDLHLGPVRGFCFARRVAALVLKLKPDVVFLAGDIYDGTAVDAVRMANVWKEVFPKLGSPEKSSGDLPPSPMPVPILSGLEERAVESRPIISSDQSAPDFFGVYYVTGNHEEFSDRTKYLRAIEGAGIRVLRNEKVSLDGLQIVGVLYGEGSERESLRKTLAQIKVDRHKPSILLSHVPQYFDVAEEAGISLQLSGHTHKGQVLPWSWLAGRVHGRFVYGLNSFKQMLVYTSSGAGTWGPPMRLGTRSEIVLITFTSH
jgi:uncharacterized protein